MNVGVLDNILWAAGLFGEVALFLVLLLRRRARLFPFFTSYIAYQAASSAVLFTVSRHFRPHIYFLCYSAFAGVDLLMQLLVIWEIARDVLRPTGTWIRDARRSFLLWSSLGILIAAALSYNMPKADLSGAELWEMRVSVLTSLLTCEIFLAMILAANRLGLQWRSHVMALSQGLTIWAVVAIGGDLGSVATGWGSNLAAFDHARQFVYVIALVFWCFAFSFPERERAPLSPEMHDYLLALHQNLKYDLERVEHLDRHSL